MYIKKTLLNTIQTNMYTKSTLLYLLTQTKCIKTTQSSLFAQVGFIKYLIDYVHIISLVSQTSQFGEIKCLCLQFKNHFDMSQCNVCTISEAVKKRSKNNFMRCRLRRQSTIERWASRCCVKQSATVAAAVARRSVIVERSAVVIAARALPSRAVPSARANRHGLDWKYVFLS